MKQTDMSILDISSKTSLYDIIFNMSILCHMSILDILIKYNQYGIFFTCSSYL